MPKTAPVLTRTNSVVGSRNPQQTEQSRTDTALLTGGLLVRFQPEEPIGFIFNNLQQLFASQSLRFQQWRGARLRQASKPMR